MKKVLTILLTLAIFLAMTTTGVSASFTDTADTKWETAVEVLEALGIVEGKAEGEYDPEGFLTRAEMTTIILRAVNMAGTSSGRDVFTDVTSEHWAYANIAAAYQLGIVNGTGETTFEPDAKVTSEQAVKMTVAALGYTVKAEAQGGYPAGYLAQASQLDLLAGVNISGEMTRGDMAILIYNALDTELFLQSTFGNDSLTFETNEAKTMLSYYLKVEHLIDKVSATPMMQYRSPAQRPERKLLSDEVAVGTRVLKSGDTDAQSLFGVRSDIYVRREGDSDTAVILAIVPRASVEIIDVKAQSIEKGQTDTELFVYTNADGKDQKISISGATFFYNGCEEPITDSLLIPTIGTVRLIVEGGSCSYVIAESFTNYIVDSKNDGENMIRLKGVATSIELDEVPTVFTDEFGVPLSIIDVAKDDILSVAESLGTDKVRRMYRCYATVKGTVTEHGTDEIRIGEVMYPVSLPLADGTIELGQSATFRFDFTGAVAAVDTSKSAGKQYGWLASAAQSRGLSGVPQIRVFTGDAEWKVFTLAEVLRFNNDSVKGESLLLPGTASGTALWAAGKAPTLFDSTGNIVPQLVTYKLNDEGLISELNTAENQTDPLVQPETKYKDNRFSMDWYWNGNRYRYAGFITEFNGTRNGNTLKQTTDGYTENVGGVFMGNVQTDADTKVFVIPTELSDEKGYGVLTMSQFDFETVRATDCGSLYDINDAYYCGAIVVHNYLAGDTAASVETYPSHDVTNALITKTSVVLGEDGEVQNILHMYDQNGKEFTVVVEEDFRALYRVANADVNKDPDWYTVDAAGERLPRTGDVTARLEKMYIDGADLQAGDVIKYTKDAGGKLTMASVCYRSRYPGNVEFSAGSSIVPTTPYLNYMGGSLQMNGFVEEVTQYGPLVRVNMANTAGMPTGETSLRALRNEGQFLVWDSAKHEMQKISREDIRLGDTVFSVWATVQQRITVIYR